MTRDGKSLDDMASLYAQSNKPQWVLMWRMFGTNGHVLKPTAGSVFTNFVKRVPECLEHPRIDHQTETSHLFRRNDRFCNQNFPSYEEGRMAALPYLEKSICDHAWLVPNGGYEGNSPHLCVGEDNDRLWALSSVVNEREIWVNHYSTRSKKEWMQKLRRGRANSEVWKRKVEEDDLSSLSDYYSVEEDFDAVFAVFNMCGRLAHHLSACCLTYLLGDGGIGLGGLPEQVRHGLHKRCSSDKVGLMSLRMR
jgi:hypothetical protein